MKTLFDLQDDIMARQAIMIEVLEDIAKELLDWEIEA